LRNSNQGSNPIFRSIVLPAPTLQATHQTMTLEGTIRKACALLIGVVSAGLWAWSRYSVPNTRGVFVAIAALCALVLVWVTAYRKQWSPFTAPAYALLEGVVVGSFSAKADLRDHGIAIQAISLTVATCFCLLIAYRSGFIRVTDRFNRGLLAATSGIALYYLASFALSMLGIRKFTAFAGGLPGILISVVIVMIAGMNLVSDFDFIEQCARSGLPKYMEWYAALGLIVTLVWLYLEILRLLSKARKAEEGG
jgi:uncharacterized YccA/Bax inhibitor family protein